MKRALALLSLLMLTGCTGRYTMDMCGLDRASTENARPTAERYTMMELDKASDAALGDASDEYSMTKLNDLSSKTFDKYTRGH